MPRDQPKSSLSPTALQCHTFKVFILKTFSALSSVEKGSKLTDGVDDQLESFVLVLVVVLGVLVQDADVDAAQDDLQIEAGRSRQRVLDLQRTRRYYLQSRSDLVEQESLKGKRQPSKKKEEEERRF